MSTPTRLFGCGPAALGITVIFATRMRAAPAPGETRGIERFAHECARVKITPRATHTLQSRMSQRSRRRIGYAHEKRGSKTNRRAKYFEGRSAAIEGDTANRQEALDRSAVIPCRKR